MFTLEIGATQAAWICGLLLVLSTGLVLLASLLLRQHRQLQQSVSMVSAQVTVFAEASISVAHTVEQSLVGAPAGRSTNLGTKPSAGRRELLQVAARRLAQNQSPLAVQQALSLGSEELKLLQIGATSAQVALEPSHSTGQDAVRQPQPVSRAPRAVA